MTMIHMTMKTMTEANLTVHHLRQSQSQNWTAMPRKRNLGRKTSHLRAVVHMTPMGTMIDAVTAVNHMIVGKTIDQIHRRDRSKNNRKPNWTSESRCLLLRQKWRILQPQKANNAPQEVMMMMMMLIIVVVKKMMMAHALHPHPTPQTQDRPAHLSASHLSKLQSRRHHLWSHHQTKTPR